jgi:hypothetical protein
MKTNSCGGSLKRDFRPVIARSVLRPAQDDGDEAIQYSRLSKRNSRGFDRRRCLDRFASPAMTGLKSFFNELLVEGRSSH